MKSVIRFMIIACFLLLPTYCLAQNPEQSNAIAAREKISRTPLNAPVELTLHSGQTVSGKLISSLETVCVIRQADGNTRLVGFAQIKNVKVTYRFFRKVARVLAYPAYAVAAPIILSTWIVEALLGIDQPQ